MFEKRIAQSLVLLATLTVTGGSSSVLAGDDFPHNRVALHTLYPDRAAIMEAMTREKDVILLGEQKDANGNPIGNFDRCVDNNCTEADAGHANWGAVALLTYWWHVNGEQDAGVAAAARRGIDFAIANRNWTEDAADTTYLRLTNTGYAHSRYYLTGDKPISNYPTTAFVLLNKAFILKYGANLFSQSQKDAVRDQAVSHWLWLTRASKYNPQNASNQTMAAILGAYLLGAVYNDEWLKAEALAYYNTGVVGTNLPPAGCCGDEPFCGGFRNVERMLVQGRYVFEEQGGFDTHYGGLQLTFNGVLYAAIGYDATSTVYTDALEQAQYIRDRLSEGGTMHGGTRNNEMSGSNTDVAFALGFNMFSPKVARDLGSTKVRNVVIDTRSPTQSHAYGTRALGIILFHEYFVPWNMNKLVRNNSVGLRRGNVSVFFDATNQPQEISVNGTVFTEAVVNRGVHSAGLYLQNADGSWFIDPNTYRSSYASTANYTIRTATANNVDPNISVKTRYITNGESLYYIMLIRFNAPTMLRSANVLTGLPNVSATKRIVRIYDAANPASYLDLSQDTGSLNRPKFRTGDVDLDGFPELRASNATETPRNSRAKWMTSAATGANWNETIQDLRRGSPGIWWSPKGNEPSVEYTDITRVHIRGNAAGDEYAPGDIIMAVAKFSPAGSSEGFNVTPVYQPGSNYKITNATIEDANMSFAFGWDASTFTDKASGEVTTFDTTRTRTSVKSNTPTATYGEAVTFTATVASSTGLLTNTYDLHFRASGDPLLHRARFQIKQSQTPGERRARKQLTVKARSRDSESSQFYGGLK